jgi:phosphonoacetaldehyde hydrolase
MLRQVVTHTKKIYPTTQRTLYFSLPANPISKAIVMDFSGTLIDPGVMAPTMAFIEVFKKYGIVISENEARQPMGQEKRTHIGHVLLKNPNVNYRWSCLHGYPPTTEDVDRIFADFVPMQCKILHRYTTLLPKTKETLDTFRKDYNLLLGASTGFNLQMTQIIRCKMKEQGVVLDAAVAGDEVRRGRPYGDMISENMERLGITNPAEVVKVGDTPMDMQEGKNAKCGMVIGLSLYNNYMGMNLQETRHMQLTNSNEFHRKLKESEDQLYAAGADLVVKELSDIIPYIQPLLLL